MVFCCLPQQAADAGSVYFYCKAIVFRVCFGKSKGAIPHTGTNIQNFRCTSAEHPVEVQFAVRVVDTKNRPMFFQGMGLPLSKTPFSQNITANFTEINGLSPAGIDNQLKNNPSIGEEALA